MTGWTITDELQAVRMEAKSDCSRCPRIIPLLGFAFLGPNYEAVCAHCAAKQLADLIHYAQTEEAPK